MSILPNYTEAIEEIAAKYLAREAMGVFSATEARERDDWLAASTLHRVAYLRLTAAWQRTGKLSLWAAGRTQSGPPSVGAWRTSPYFHRGPLAEAAEPTTAKSLDSLQAVGTNEPNLRRKLFGSRHTATIAAAVLLIVGVGALTLNFYDRNHFATAIGGLQQIPLADGSRITLNTDTDVRVRLTTGTRTVLLERGEAYFEVAKDATRPFVVDTGRTRIIAVGTAFSVQRQGVDTRVTVTEGHVRVEPKTRAAAAPIVLAAGSAATSDGVGVLVAPVTDTEEATSWREGYLVFHDIELGDAAAAFNRYNARTLVVADPALAKQRIGGHFRATNVEAFVRLLIEDTAIQVQETPDRIVLSAARP